MATRLMENLRNRDFLFYYKPTISESDPVLSNPNLCLMLTLRSHAHSPK